MNTPSATTHAKAHIPPMIGCFSRMRGAILASFCSLLFMQAEAQAGFLRFSAFGDDVRFKRVTSQQDGKGLLDSGSDGFDIWGNRRAKRADDNGFPFFNFEIECPGQLVSGEHQCQLDYAYWVTGSGPPRSCGWRFGAIKVTVSWDGRMAKGKFEGEGLPATEEQCLPSYAEGLATEPLKLRGKFKLEPFRQDI